jgi:hypothetical protein
VTVQELIDKLAAMPPYADVLFDDIEVEEYRDITVELGGVYGDAALVLIGLEPEVNQ